VLVTEWEEFGKLDLRKMKKLMARPLIIDGRNMFDPSAVTAQGFSYVCMGRGLHEVKKTAQKQKNSVGRYSCA
jgi:UDPglucose 6-dehydrogenase